MKTEVAENLGFKLLTIWENDYNINREETIDIAQNFIIDNIDFNWENI